LLTPAVRELRGGHMDKKMSLGKLLRFAVWALAIGALVQELKKPADQREWTGTIAGFVPYDYRLPTASRVRDRLWNPDGPLISPQVFGVGWSINFGKLVSAFKNRAS